MLTSLKFYDKTCECEQRLQAAAVTIQKVWRGHAAKVKVEILKRNFLSYSLFEKTKPYIEIASNRQNLPRASYGKTPVYLPTELPIVLKQSGSPQNQKRFDQMRAARQICVQNSYTQLEIPKARIYNGFIIERKLPIRSFDIKDQIVLYSANRDRFTTAAQEFIGFLCQSTLADAVSLKNPYCSLSRVPVGRYDNFPLYLENGQGKIGLIDLERFSPGCDKRQPAWCFSRCCDAIYLFPYHLDEIINAAKKFDPEIENYRNELEEKSNEALKRFKIVYDSHLEFIQEKNITIHQPLKIVEITSKRQEYLKQEITSLLREEYRYVYSNRSDIKFKVGIDVFEETFPQVLGLINNFLTEALKSKIESFEPFISTEQLLCFRTIILGSMNDWWDDLNKQVAVKLNMMPLNDEDKKDLANLIIRSIFTEMVNGGELAYYNPRFGVDGYGTCIFC